jgi:biotin transport system substrate-specific component
MDKSNQGFISSFALSKENTTKLGLKIIFGIIVLAIAAQFSVPLKPVPLTFQSTTVIMLGLLFGPRTAGLIVFGYLLAGISGIPVFADFTFGINEIFGPKGGYLLGFLPAAVIAGYLAQQGYAKHLLMTFVSICIATSIIFFCGYLQLSFFFGQEEAFAFGITPFIYTELTKMAAAAILFSRIKRTG